MALFLELAHIVDIHQFGIPHVILAVQAVRDGVRRVDGGQAGNTALHRLTADLHRCLRRDTALR